MSNKYRKRKTEMKTRKLENKKKKSLEIEKGLVDGSEQFCQVESLENNRNNSKVFQKIKTQEISFQIASRKRG